MSSIRRALPRVLPLAATGAVLVLSVTACAGGGGSGTSSAGGDGGRIRVALAFPPAQAMSPFGDDAVTLSRLAVAEGLTALGRNGEALPALATEWKPDGDKAWTFTLRKAVFQDGKPLDAQAVVRALDAAEKASPKPRVLSDTDIGATAQSPQTVRITTKKPDALLPQRLANPSLSIFSEGAYKAGGKVDPVGHATGPYTLSKLNGAVSATLTRNDSYWGAKAKAPGVDVKFVADGKARANALRAGQTDIAESVPVSQVSLLAEGQAREVPTARTNSLYLNTEKGPFTDAGLRASVRTAIDSKALVEGVYEGRADTAQGLFGPGVAWAAKQRVPVAGRASAAPQEKAAAAGEIVLGTYTNRPELPEVATAVQQQLEKAGFEVRQVVRDYAQMEADALDGKFDAFILPRNTLLDTGDPSSYLSSDFTCAGSFNLSQLCDKDVDAAVAKTVGAVDTPERQQAEMAAEAKVLGTDAVIPLVHERFVQGVREGVEGVSLDPMERTLITADTRIG
ncbi:ABC transporter substrate-binding protein [Streptomyces sp. CA-294286]|uniref:ABC transporter substrate-binding protein n=1 Tax=Streptomyces sp. CA-294286 TaxID=3240070 RepID=UPI003D92B744